MKSHMPIKLWLLRVCCMCDIEGVFVLALTRQEWFGFYLPISLSICVCMSVCEAKSETRQLDMNAHTYTHTDAYLIRNVY